MPCPARASGITAVWIGNGTVMPRALSTAQGLRERRARRTRSRGESWGVFLLSQQRRTAGVNKRRRTDGGRHQTTEATGRTGVRAGGTEVPVAAAVECRPDRPAQERSIIQGAAGLTSTVPLMGPDPTRSAAMVNLVLSHRLTLVVAAAGWGKSTLLRRLADDVSSFVFTRPPAGWTPSRSPATSSTRSAPPTPELVAGALPAYSSADSQNHQDQLAALAAAVGAVAADVVTADTVVAIDDADVPPGDPMERFLEALVLSLPRACTSSSPAGRNRRCGSPGCGRPARLLGCRRPSSRSVPAN